jgi:hypothetical protein
MRKPLTSHCVIVGLLLLACQHTRISAQELAEQSRSLLVFFDRITVTLDSATFGAIAHSDFVTQELAAMTRTSVIDGEDTLEGFRLTGEHTSVEFRPATASSHPGDCALGFSVNIEGGLEILYARMAEQFGERANRELQYMDTDSGSLAWYHHTWLDEQEGETSPVWLWVMEYHRSFLATLPVAIPADHLNRAREVVNADEYRPDAFLGDVERIVLALDSYEADELRDQLQLFGYELTLDDGKTVARGPGVELVIVPTLSLAPGLVEMTLSLTKSTSGVSAYTFGEQSMLLVHEDGSATWKF